MGPGATPATAPPPTGRRTGAVGNGGPWWRCQMTPCASIASATRSKPAMLAPVT